MRLGLTLIILTALAAVVPASASAWPACVERKTPIRLGLTEVDRSKDGRVITLTLRSRALPGVTRVNVTLPRRYDASGRTRYPVLYWLHGAGSSYRNWIEDLRGLELMGDMPLIVVSPDGGANDSGGARRNGSYMDWFGLEPGEAGPAFAFESYHVRELIPFIDARFPTRPSPAGRAVAGISMGGGGVRYAAAFPGTFGYAGSFSGALAHAPSNQNCIRPDPERVPVVWRDNSAIDLAVNLRGVRLFVRSGDGTPGPLDPSPPDAIRLGTEAAAHAAARLFLNALAEAGIGGVDAELYPGSHFHPYWQRELPEFMAWLRTQLRQPVKTRTAFKIENAREDFTAWGWRFVARRRAREFVYLRVNGGVVTAKGSGKLDIATPPRYRPRATYAVRLGRKVRGVRADRFGRLAFTLDLGPSHTRQQTRFGAGATRHWRTARAKIGDLAVPGFAAAEPIVRQVVPLPESITEVQFPGYDASGSRILAAASSTAFSGTQIVSFRDDGSGLRCLTCRAWDGVVLTKPFAFRDGRRVLVRIGQQAPLMPADHGVVECSPSVLRCREAKVVPIVPPAGRDRNVEQDQRELRIAPDDRHVALTQVRRSRGGRSIGIGIVGRLVRRATVYRVADARVVAVDGELKGFSADGAGITFARFLGAYEAGNPDDVEIRLARGRERRLTYAPDWEEDVDLGPHRHRGREWMVVGSARGSGLLEPVARIRRPTAIETGLSALPFSLFGLRGAEIAEPWLVDRSSERAGSLGQPLAPGAVARGWDSRAVTRWKPDGTAVVFWQRRIGGSGTRVVVARLPARRPRRPRAHTTPTPRWAPRLAGYAPPDPALPRSRDGRVSGRMEIAERPSPLPGYDSFVEVVYSGFADRRGFVIDGVERSYYDAPALYGSRSLYSANLTVSGRHTGYLRATNVGIGEPGIRGTIESELDGRRMTLGPLP